MSRKTAERKHEQTADAHQRNLVALIKRFGYAHHVHTVFSDFVELSALSISNSVDRQHFERREARYKAIIQKYSPAEQALFPQMFAELTLSFELRVNLMQKAGGRGLGLDGLTDVLGATYMMLELGNAGSGQFFTPYPVSRMMAMMTIGDGGEAVREHGFLRLQEPACGAGGMVIAVAESLNDAGHNYQQAMHATCIDIDPCCVHMAYVQLSLLHIPAMVVHGNALSVDVWGFWYTPAHVLGGWTRKLRRREAETLAAESLTAPGSEPVAAAAVVDLEPAYDRAEGEVARVTNEEGEPLSVTLTEVVSPTMPAKVFARIDQLALF